MKEIKIKQTVIFGILSVLVVGFIFSQSLQRSEQSNAVSGGVMEWLRVILGPLFDSDDVMHKFVRKAAHFIEFSALGGCLGLFTDGLKDRFWRGWAVFMPLFTVLLTAVVDEFIQSFTDRSSMLKDVVLDFSGGLFGIVCSVIFLHAVLWLYKKRG